MIKTPLVIVTPVYEDTESLYQLAEKIESIYHDQVTLIAVEDGSLHHIIDVNQFPKRMNFHILRLKRNVGHQKAIAIGLCFLEDKIIDTTKVVIMDSDGEDDSTKINEMTSLANQNREFVVVSCRTKRVEGVFFNILYNIHKFLTFIFTLRWMNFGNYSSFHSSNITKILKKNYAWLAYSSAVSKNCKTKRVYAPRKKRFFGRSKLTSLGLFLHSLRVNLVFFPTIILTSFFYIYLIYFLSFKTFLSFSFISLILLYNCLLISVMMSSKLKDLEETKKFISEKID